MPTYSITPQQPYGAIIQSNVAGQNIEQFSKEEIYNWIQQYRIIIFRGFKQLPKQDFAVYGQKIGEPLQWPFGAINELKVKVDAKNYIYTDRDVPFHWDGAFAGKIPYIILFQCLVAPAPENKGGTTFVDTTKILNDATPEELAEWQNTTITYRTEKIVHYGGKITQRFIAPHPVTGEQVIRFAEPVTDLNPVTLQVHGYTPGEQQLFICKMKEKLYDPKYCYVHYWQDGDIVMADNHALLHGREAFLKANERFIQRINILHRKPMSLQRFFRLSLMIRRKEFFVAELPIFIIPVLLCVGYWEAFTQLNFWLGIIAGFLLFNIGDMINCYADHDLDAIYKSHLSNAVYELGKKNVFWQMIISGMVAFALTTVIAVNTEQLYLIPLTIIGGFIGLQYSVKPFHFKNRGMWQLLCLWGIIFFGPMLYISITTAAIFPSVVLLLLFAAYGFHQMGIILLNTAEDYTEDKTAGLNTIIVFLGLHRAMRFALTLIIFNGIALQALFAMLYHQYNLPLYLYPAILIFTVGWLYIAKGFNNIVKKIADKNEIDATEELKKNGMKVPEWLKIGAYTSLAVAFVLFAYRIIMHL